MPDTLNGIKVNEETHRDQPGDAVGVALHGVRLPAYLRRLSLCMLSIVTVVLVIVAAGASHHTSGGFRGSRSRPNELAPLHRRDLVDHRGVCLTPGPIDPILDQHVIQGMYLEIIEAAEKRCQLLPTGVQAQAPPRAVVDATAAKRWDLLVAYRTQRLSEGPGDLYLQLEPCYVQGVALCDSDLYEAALDGDWWRLLRRCGEWLQRCPRDAAAAWLALAAYDRVGMETVKRARAFFDHEEECAEPGPQDLLMQPAIYFAARCVLLRPDSPIAWSLLADAIATDFREVSLADVAALRAATHAVALAPDDPIALRVLQAASTACVRTGVPVCRAELTGPKGASLTLQWHHALLHWDSSEGAKVPGWQAEPVELRWQARPAESAYAVAYWFTNTGSTPIDRGDFREPLRFSATARNVICRVSTSVSSCAEPPAYTLSDDAHLLTLHSTHLAPGETLEVDFVFLGYDYQPDDELRDGHPFDYLHEPAGDLHVEGVINGIGDLSQWRSQLLE